MAEIKKFLDQEGVKFLWSKISMQDYPNNDTLMAVIEAIDETKADKTDLVQSDWNTSDETNLSYIKNRPFYDGTYRNYLVQDFDYNQYNYNYEFHLEEDTFNGDEFIYIELNGTQYEARLTLSEPDYKHWNYTVQDANGILIEVAIRANGIDNSWINIKREGLLPAIGSIFVIEGEIKQIEEKYIPDTIATKEYVNSLYQKLSSNTVLGFYCIEDVTIVTNGVSVLYPANSNIEITFTEDDVFEIIPTSDKSILTLTSFPGPLGTFYPWLEGVRQFSNILFDMNSEDMYIKWNQGNQGAYQVQFAQYTNCIFWSDNPYINDVAKRTNYTLYYTAQLPLCYSNIPDNTFKAFYLALSVNNDPNWSNPAYRDSFAKATWATQVFSYYGARTIGIPGHDNSTFNIVLPADCRGLMYAAENVQNAGVFDATNVTNFGAKSGSWRDAFGYCTSLKRLYIKNLKVNLNISWSPVDYDSIYFIISEATNTSAITISVSPYTYYLLSDADFELATSKNITIELLNNNYVEDRRLNEIANKIDRSEIDNMEFITVDDIDTICGTTIINAVGTDVKF